MRVGEFRINTDAGTWELKMEYFLDDSGEVRCLVLEDGQEHEADPVYRKNDWERRSPITAKDGKKYLKALISEQHWSYTSFKEIKEES
jgi:hypothetical protein